MDYISQFLFLTVAAAISMSLNSEAIPDKYNDHMRKLEKLPSFVDCGKDSQYYEPRIFGGVYAKLGQIPWMASIGYTNDSLLYPQWLCAGSLITDQYVITAAHCLINKYTKMDISVVRLGDLDLDPYVEDGATESKDFHIEKTIPHEHFHDDPKENDIGLIKLNKRVNFEESIRPICLPPVDFLNELYVTHYTAVAGWGTINGSQNTKLYKGDVQIISTKDCQNRYGNDKLDDRVICATSSETKICQGDAGGPLMLFVDKGLHKNVHLMGIVTHGFTCTSDTHPGVYIRVAKYMEWIVDNLDI